MKLFIQGRKDGYKVLFPKPTPSEFFQFAGDLRPDGNNNQLLGKSFYTLAFAPGGHIFTKQLIIQDVQRQGLGNIGFSLFIPAQKKMPGEQVIALLDELVKSYTLNYCPDYYLDFVQEDWVIFENIVSKYHVYLKNNFQEELENHPQGTEDPAYLYYSDILELQRFFDAPAQEEYAKFKQVFFIDKSLESQSNNPLKAIRHNSNGNLTGKIDLNNQSYRLIYATLSQGGVRLEVKVNGMPLLNKNQIKHKDHLEITWSKAYHESTIIKGSCLDIGSPYLLINEESRTITIKDIALNERTFKFHVKAVDKFSRPILDAELVAYSQNNKREMTLVNNSIILREEELNENYYVIGKKGNLESEPKALAKMGAYEEITLTLLETVKLIIKPLDNRDGSYVPDAKITFVDKTNSPSGNSAEFRGDELNKNWQIIIAHPEYRTKTITYCPAKDPNEKVVQLEKLPLSEKTSLTQPERKFYWLEIDQKKGKKSWKGKPLDLTGKEFQQDEIRCDAKYGYKFSKWEKVETKGQQDIYEAIFQELWYRKVPKVVWGILPVIIAAGIYIAIPKDLENKGGGDGTTTTPTKTKIEEYLNGNSLLLDSLNAFNDSYDSILSADKGLKEKLDNAIEFRVLLNKGELDSLVKKSEDFFVSASQQNIKTKIDKLFDSKTKDAAIGRLKDPKVWDEKALNQLSLDKIGEKIDELNRKITNNSTAADEGGTQPAPAEGGTNPSGASVGGGEGDIKNEIINEINELLSAEVLNTDRTEWDRLQTKAETSGLTEIAKDIEYIKNNLKNLKDRTYKNIKNKIGKNQ